MAIATLVLAYNLYTIVSIHACTIVYVFDTLFFANNSLMQWAIMMKFISLGSPLKSVQIQPKRLHLVKGQRSYEAIKISHIFTMGMWFDHSYFEYT